MDDDRTLIEKLIDAYLPALSAMKCRQDKRELTKFYNYVVEQINETSKKNDTSK